MVHLRCLALIISLLAAVLAQQDYQDTPPSIISIVVNNVFVIGGDEPDPAAFVQVLDNGYIKKVFNEITCRATNAQTIKLQYSQNGIDGSWSDTLPDILEIKDEERTGNEVTLQVTDGTTTLITELTKWNGYYRCFTQTIVSGNTYVTASPPIMLILPSSGPHVDEASPTETAFEGKSYTLPCVRDDNSILPDMKDKFRLLSGKLTFTWKLTLDGKNNLDYMDIISSSGGRIKMDPITGALYYAYLTADDNLPASTAGSTNQLICSVKVDNIRDSELNNVISWTIQASSSGISQFEFLAPVVNTLDNDDDTVAEAKDAIECVEGQACNVVCIFGGSLGKEGKITIVAPPDSENANAVIQTTDTGFEFTPVANKNPEEWECTLLSETNEKIATVKIQIKILNYPKITVGQDFPVSPRYEPSGKLESEFICAASFADTTKFYINGDVVQEGETNGISLDRDVPNRLIYKNLNTGQSGSILCATEGTAGSSYATASLIVYEPAILVQTPEGAITIIEAKDGKNASETSHAFVCNSTLDSRTSEARILWYYKQDSEVVQVTEDNNKAVQTITSPAYQSGQTFITSQLSLEYTLDSDPVLRKSFWYCELTYSVLDSPTYTATAENIEYIVETATQPYVAPPPWPHWPLVGGVVGGFLFLVLLIVLINCYVQKNRGEQYYVDEKERKAGHNPEEELAEYGFSDYSRADQNPIKGSRASMNFSDKPMESDTGSLDEYGDIDPGRYNEDGSFINGQYGQKHGQQSRNQADV